MPNPIYTPAPPRPSRRAWILVLLLAVPGVFVLVLVTGCFRLSLSRDTAELRGSVMDTSTVEWEKQIEIGAGPIPFHFARFLLRFVDVEPDLRQAAKALKNAEVGIYQSTRTDDNFTLALTAADQSMEKRGWERVAGVVNDRSCVLIYIPKKTTSSAVRLAVVVLEDRQMVIVSGRADLKPIWELARKHMRDHAPRGNTSHPPLRATLPTHWPGFVLL